MSLLWPNRLEVLLSSQGAAVIDLSAGFGKSKLKQQFVPAINNNDVPNWQPVSNSLDALLNAIQVKPNTHLSLVLSSDFIRYQFLPAQQISMSATEKLAYSAAAYKQIYGVEIGDWRLKLHETGFNQASICAAVQAYFLDKLQQVSKLHQIKLISIQPYLMQAYNSCIKQLSQLNGYFVIVESSRILLLNMQLGRCQYLRMAAIGSDWQQDLKQLLARESMLNDESDNVVLLYAPTYKNLLKIEGWRIERVDVVHKQALVDNHLTKLGVSI